MPPDGRFRFNGSRRDLEQVAEFLPEFLSLFEQLEPGQALGVDAFRARIPAIAGSHEAIAIWLLQQLRLKRQLQDRVASLLAAGYRHVAYVPFGGQRFEHVIVYGDYGDHDTGSHAWDEFRYARLVPQTNLHLARRTGPILGVIPYQRRTVVRRVFGERVLAKDLPESASPRRR